MFSISRHWNCVSFCKGKDKILTRFINLWDDWHKIPGVTGQTTNYNIAHTVAISTNCSFVFLSNVFSFSKTGLNCLGHSKWQNVPSSPYSAQMQLSPFGRPWLSIKESDISYLCDDLHDVIWGTLLSSKLKYSWDIYPIYVLVYVTYSKMDKIKLTITQYVVAILNQSLHLSIMIQPQPATKHHTVACLLS